MYICKAFNNNKLLKKHLKTVYCISIRRFPLNLATFPLVAFLVYVSDVQLKVFLVVILYNTITETDNWAGESASTGLHSDVLNIEFNYFGDKSNLCVVKILGNQNL